MWPPYAAPCTALICQGYSVPPVILLVAAGYSTAGATEEVQALSRLLLPAAACSGLVLFHGTTGLYPCSMRGQGVGRDDQRAFSSTIDVEGLGMDEQASFRWAGSLDGVACLG